MDAADQRGQAYRPPPRCVLTLIEMEKEGLILEGGGIVMRASILSSSNSAVAPAVR